MDLRLSPKQRRELIRLLAEEGPQALEAWLRRESSQDPRIRARLEAERLALEREARAAERRLADEHAAANRAAESDWEREVRLDEERQAALHERLRSLERGALSIDDLVAQSALYRALVEPRKATLGRRVAALIQRAWMFLVSLWVAFVRLLTGRKAPQIRHAVPMPAGVPFDMSHLGPDALVAVRKTEGGWRGRLRRARDRLLGRETMREELARRLAEEQDRVQAQERRRREEEQRRIQDDLAKAGDAGHAARERLRREEEERKKRQKREMDALAERLERGPLERLRAEIVEDFQSAGLVDASGHATGDLISRYARTLYDEARRSLPAQGQAVPGTYVEGQGEYEVGPLRSEFEMGAMDLASSVLQARIRHPHVRHIYDQDVLVHREVRMAKAHVVLVVDTSNSMEEAGRLGAAKKVALVLHRAVKDRDPGHRIDFLRMSTSVEQVDLGGVWKAEPTGFTNHGAALREAKRLFDHHSADQRLLYLITDGLPEAFTKPDGTDKADRPDVCMAYALKQAKELREVPGLRTTVLQLENTEPRYVESARQLAQACGGEVEAIEPSDLLAWVLGDYDAPAP